jgi:hypothetical protein
MNSADRETTNQLVELNKLSRFQEIFELCFGFKASEEYFKWKYLENPAGKLIAFETVNNTTHEIGAFYGIIPEEYMINGERKIIFQSMDTMTHPDYRNRGLFIKLAGLTYDHAYKQFNGLQLIGIPGTNSFHGFVKKLGWKNPHNFSYIFQHRLILKSTLLFNKKTILLEEIKQFDGKTDEFFNKKKNYKPIYKVYNKEILNWKITNHPFHKFISYKIIKDNELIGIIILQKEQRNLKIIYVDFLDNEMRKFLKDTISSLCNKIKFSYIYTWEPADAFMAKQFKKNLFFKNPFNRGLFSYKVPLILLSRNNELQKTQWEDANNIELQPIIQD